MHEVLATFAHSLALRIIPPQRLVEAKDRAFAAGHVQVASFLIDYRVKGRATHFPRLLIFLKIQFPRSRCVHCIRSRRSLPFRQILVHSSRFVSAHFYLHVFVVSCRPRKFTNFVKLVIKCRQSCILPALSVHHLCTDHA